MADRILAIETSSRHGSAALGDGPRLVAERPFATNVEHARELLPSLDALCREAGWPPESIRQVHVSIGPGSFTGLRVAVTFARHFALAVGAEICAVPSLDVIAQNALDAAAPPEHLAVVLDAKRGQVFAGLFRHVGDRYGRVRGPELCEPGQWLATQPRPLTVTGEGINYHREAIAGAGVAVLEESLWAPRAGEVHVLGWRLAHAGRFTRPQDLAPVYVRRPEAEELWEKRHAGLPK